MDLGQVADDHDHRRFQEQSVRVDPGKAAPLGDGRHRYAVDEQDQRDKERSFRYHEAASVLKGLATSWYEASRVGYHSGTVCHL